MNLAFLDAKKIQIVASDETQFLVMGGQRAALGPPRRALPLSQPEKFILLQDKAGRQLGVIEATEQLDPASRELLQEALNRTYVITTITRILYVNRDPLTGQVRWRVLVETEGEDAETTPLEDPEAALAALADPQVSFRSRVGARLSFPTKDPLENGSGDTRGRQLEFTISGPEDVQTARYPHIYLVDVQGNRYQILECEALDLDSRKAAERYF